MNRIVTILIIVFFSEILFSCFPPKKIPVKNSLTFSKKELSSGCFASATEEPIITGVAGGSVKLTCSFT